MIRTQISLAKEDKKAINHMAGWHNVSQSEIIRRAIRDFSQKFNKKLEDRKALFERLAGSWANSPNWKGVDGSKYQRQIRREKGI